ncbi:hypothetical protein EHM76_07385 [bacterium]|nr:MAG: hypothetical protein EHM76_07385 [bacterium]
MYGTDSGDHGDSDAEGLKENLGKGWMQDWKYFTTDDTLTSPDVNGSFKGLKLPKEVIGKIYYENAARLFK